MLKQLTFKNNYNSIEIPTSCCWSNTRNSIYVSYISPNIKNFDIETGKSIIDYSFQIDKALPFENQQINKIAFLGNNGGNTTNLLVTANEDRQLRIFDANSS